MPTLGQKIKKLRKSKEMSQEDFAEVFNVARQTVSKWESGIAIPNTDNITAISKYFGVTVEYLTSTNGKEHIETAATTDTTTEKKSISIGWIVGVVLSCIIPLFDLVAVIIYFITKSLPLNAFASYSSEFMNWKFFWFIFALTCVSLASLTILIVYRIKVTKKSISDKMSPKGDRH